MASDDVTISLRARGAARTARDVNTVHGSVTRLGSAVAATGRVSANVGRSLRTDLGGGLSFVTRQAKYAGLAVGAVGVLGVKAGLDFNASMEQNTVAFGQFLGSSRAARKELHYLNVLAANTPFERLQITDAARKLLAFNFPLKQTNSLLKTMGDTAAGAALGSDALNDMARTLGQIQAKGRLQAEELIQLEELGVINPNKLAKNLGITGAQLADAGNQSISANRAIRAIQKTLDDTFGGQASKQAKTYSGQLSSIHDNVDMLLGSLTKPGFDLLKARVFPAVAKTTEELQKISDRKDIDLGEKITLSRAVLKRNMGPFVDELGQVIEDAHLGHRAADAFEDAVPMIADKAASAAPQIAGAFWKGFMDAGPYGKVFLALATGAKVKGMLGGGAWGVRGPVGGGSAANPVAVVGIGGGVPGVPGLPGKKGKGTGKLGKLGKVTGAAGAAGATIGSKALRVAKVAGPLAVVGTAADALVNASTAGLDPNTEAAMIAKAQAEQRRNGRRARAAAPHHRRRGDLHVTVPVNIDGREVGKATARFFTDEAARGRKRNRP